MMRVSKEQVAAFEPAATRSFTERVARALREHFPGLAPVTDDELSAFVRLGMARAEAHGLRQARYIQMYTGLMVHLGADFDRSGEHPWAAEILRATETDAGTRMALLYQRAEALPGPQDQALCLRAGLLSAPGAKGGSGPTGN